MLVDCGVADAGGVGAASALREESKALFREVLEARGAVVRRAEVLAMEDEDAAPSEVSEA
ncbi:MAG: hypothetical protein AAGH89_10110 [Verrucomicrobiota bacterium]